MINNQLYLDDIRGVAGQELPWEKMQDSSILITGASGLIGTILCDVIMYKNRTEGLGCHVYAIGRNEEKAHHIFFTYWDDPDFSFIAHDINTPLGENEFLENMLSYLTEKNRGIGYVVHLASNTHPRQYSTDPIGTITSNVIGLKNMLDFAAEHQAVRFAFASSNEIYGENRGDTEKFDEEYCGYIDCNTLRAGYPESKRCGEALCQAYIRQKGIDAVIPRLTRSYGPTLKTDDSKALSQFLHNCINKEDIVLKSQGTQYYSYLYAADSAAGLLYVLLKGECGEAYNIADDASDIMLKDLAQILADIAGRKVIFELPDNVESAGYSKATKARLDSAKLQKLGWKARFDISEGLKRTVEILSDMN